MAREKKIIQAFSNFAHGHHECVPGCKAVSWEEIAMMADVDGLAKKFTQDESDILSWRRNNQTLITDRLSILFTSLDLLCGGKPYC